MKLFKVTRTRPNFYVVARIFATYIGEGRVSDVDRVLACCMFCFETLNYEHIHVFAKMQIKTHEYDAQEIFTEW